MFRFLPILLLVLQSVPYAGTVDAAPAITDSTQQMTCCGGYCQCAANGCRCEQDQQEAPAPTKNPFSLRTIDLAPSASPSSYQLPLLALTSEIVRVPQAKVVVASNNCRQALLGRWQN